MASPSNLTFRVSSQRQLISNVLTGTAWILTITAAVPLFLVIYHLYSIGFAEAASHLSWKTLTDVPPTANAEPGTGGFGNCLQGTAILVGLAFLMSAPTGVAIAIYLSELSPNSYLSSVVRFATRLLTGLPSILAGVFAYVAVVRATTGRFSTLAGAVGLAVLMLPMIIVTAEAAFLAVPRKMREAAFGMGATRTQTIWRVSLPYALPNIFTGMLLSIARAAGETAPLLFTASWTMYYMRLDIDDMFIALFKGDMTKAAKEFGDMGDDLFQSTPSISRLIYDFGRGIDPWQQQLAWTAALVLVLFILVLNIIAQIVSARVRRHH